MPKKETKVKRVSKPRDTKVFGVVLSSSRTFGPGRALLHDILECASSRNASGVVINQAAVTTSTKH